MAAIQEETTEPDGGHKANINWDYNSRTIDTAAISISSKDNDIHVSTEISPFLVDSGASTSISPFKGDFTNIRSYTRQVKGIGGSVIDAYGIGDIKIRITKDTTLLLKNSLYIPSATVRLVSVSSLTRDSRVQIHFDHESCWVTSKLSSDIIANGILIPNKNLYALTTFQPNNNHAYSLSYTPDLTTWHRRLGHANFQAVTTMARKGMISGMPSSFLIPLQSATHVSLGNRLEHQSPKFVKLEKGTRRRDG